jgi:hypothetical protein
LLVGAFGSSIRRVSELHEQVAPIRKQERERRAAEQPDLEAAAPAGSEGSPRGVVWVEKIYAPVVWLHDHTILEKPLEMYSKLWGW